MRIYTHPSQLLHVNAISRDGEGNDVEGRLYYVQAGTQFQELRFQSQHFDLGCNGLTNEALIEILRHRLQVLQDRAPCEENVSAMHHLTEAQGHLEDQEARVNRERAEALNAG